MTESDWIWLVYGPTIIVLIILIHEVAWISIALDESILLGLAIGGFIVNMNERRLRGDFRKR